MQPAAFSLENYQFDKVSIDLENHLSKELALDFNTSGVYFSDTLKYELTFLVSLFNDDSEKTFVKVRCKGIFVFENLNSFEDIPDYFYKNSIAILFPYLRAYLSLVTTQANVCIFRSN